MTRSVAGSAVVAVVLWMCVALPALAQFLPPENPAQPPRSRLSLPGDASGGGPGGMSPGADPFMLLANSQRVQADLGLSDDQIRRVSRANQMLRAQRRELARAPDASSRASLQRKIQTDQRAIDRIVTPDQLRRLQEIMLQLEGPCLAIHDKHFIQELSLSEDQQRQIATTCRQADRDMRSALRPPRAGEDPCIATRTKHGWLEKTRSQGRRRVLELLSERQRETLEQMQGREITVEPMTPPHCGQSGVTK